MLHEIAEAAAHRDHTATVTWADGVRGVVCFAAFLAEGGVFAELNDPDYFVPEMRILRGGIALSWRIEVDFSLDGLRQDAFPEEQLGEYDDAVRTAEEITTRE